MKKVLIILLSMVFSLSLAGCAGNSDTTTEPPAKSTDEPKEQVDQTPPNNDTDDSPENSNGNNDSDDEPISVSETAQTILQLLKNKDMKTLSTHVHPDHGLLFSPYVYVYPEEAIKLKAAEVEGFFEDQEKYVWGVRDGSGEPIELTPSEYYEEFIYTHDYHTVDPIIDEVHQRGNALNNIKEVFPEATVLEFHVEGTEKYSGMDWGSLNLVFQEDSNGVFYLVAIVRDQWTI
ncbi:hypothetical protein IMZ08_21125 [Bacillus luteolus]|uniref:Uncharacterized protein n=1 Tax=Litchfieldia luteola TaxID=682179 RepID=A0ABR9QQS1_9BACI|nr:hypothetical protein [Cytobacillus luteolus]MBE4910544.1 hypothetical protein [Cytobacillus luteolus]MBP1943721.1 hypothetical protein [Cytobacillus luteolus]